MHYYILICIMVIHGLIHIMGFTKAYGYGDTKALKAPVSRPLGALWLLAALFFPISAFLLLLHNDYWKIMAAVSVVLSQALIFTVWQDAKWGTIANIIIAISIAAAYTH